jgi:predicted O-linked N-acetylglucosamine transferase (SPINDLY family)
MQNEFAEVTPRNFDAMAAAGLSDEARKAVDAAFDAMSNWRIETAKSSEKNIEQVIEKMAAAARALGWPEEIVETIRAQMQSITKMQIQTMDHVMDAWEDQIKAPSRITPSAMLLKLKSFPGMSPAGTWPSADTFQAATANPMQFWMQCAEQWQKATAEAMAFWTRGDRPSDAAGRSRR